MKKLTNDNILNKILGDEIVAQTGLDKKYVLNGKSLFGANMRTTIDSIAESFKEDDTFIVFTLECANTSDNMVEETTDDKIDVYDSFTFIIMVYGKDFYTMAQRIDARFQTSEVLTDLHNQGVHIQDVDISKCYDDFINGKLLGRRDVTLHISAQFLIDKVTKNATMDNLNTVTVETIETV